MKAIMEFIVFYIKAALKNLTAEVTRRDIIWFIDGFIMGILITLALLCVEEKLFLP